MAEREMDTTGEYEADADEALAEGAEVVADEISPVQARIQDVRMNVSRDIVHWFEPSAELMDAFRQEQAQQARLLCTRTPESYNSKQGGDLEKLRIRDPHLGSFVIDRIEGAIADLCRPLETGGCVDLVRSGELSPIFKKAIFRDLGIDPASGEMEGGAELLSFLTADIARSAQAGRQRSEWWSVVFDTADGVVAMRTQSSNSPIR